MLGKRRYWENLSARAASNLSVPRLFIMNFAHHGPDGGDTERKGPVLVMPPPPPRKTHRWQRWRNRLFLGELIFICLFMGILLVTVPWTPYWSENSLIAGYPGLHELLMHDFVRGLISGLGLVDIYLAIAEAVHYREYFE